MAIRREGNLLSQPPAGDHDHWPRMCRAVTLASPLGLARERRIVTAVGTTAVVLFFVGEGWLDPLSPSISEYDCAEGKDIFPESGPNSSFGFVRGWPLRT